jgi:hypothetical protein
MKVDGGVPVGEVYLSRWPDNTPGQFKASIQAITYGAGAVTRSYANDVKAEGGRSPHSVRLTSVDETAIKNAIDANAKKGYYQFFTDNCAVQVRECLDAGVGGSSIMKLVAFPIWQNPIASWQLNSTPWGCFRMPGFCVSWLQCWDNARLPSRWEMTLPHVTGNAVRHVELACTAMPEWFCGAATG